MAKRKQPDQKLAELKRSGTLNPHSTAITDSLFRENPFFNANDLLQVRYEMLRRHRVDDTPIVEVSTAFGVSRPTFYQAQAAFARAGLAGLVPKPRGPKQGHKLSNEVIDHVRGLQSATPGLTARQCMQAVEQKFGISVHRRSLERALAGKKKPRKTA